MKDKKEYAPNAESISRLTRWKPIILHRGAKVAKPQPKIVKCFAEIAIEEKVIDKKRLRDLC